MIKIEMTTEVTEQFPNGHVGEYLWMIGQDWPVPMGQDSRVQRIESWGPELDFTKEFQNGTEHANGLVKQWIRPHAPIISGKMRLLLQRAQ